MKKTLLSVLVALVVLAACGSTTSKGSSGSPPTKPTRIVSMSATTTEMLFAIGADDQVVAVDDQSNYPASAPKTKLSAYTPNAEAIAKYRPDLVVISGDSNGLTAALKKLKIKVLDLPAAVTIADTYKEITQLGSVTGHPAGATSVNAKIKSGIAKALAKLKPRTKPLSYYYELDNTLYTVTSKTFVGSLFTMAKMNNVADAADPANKSAGYPQLSAEYLVNANPDLVFLADSKCCQQNEQSFGARPGFATMTAVKQHHVITLDDDIASRWGPRVVDLLDRIVTAANAVPAA